MGKEWVKSTEKVDVNLLDGVLAAELINLVGHFIVDQWLIVVYRIVTDNFVD